MSGKEFIGKIFSSGRARGAHYLWRPQLRDLGDELVPEAPARFGVVLLAAAEAIRRIGR
ncbi:MAG TPA: hypothetical protein VNW90_14895 [Acetobacteraceae bacterium]|nr:hypothetical protein [Acetobacteraceae bacterium]